MFNHLLITHSFYLIYQNVHTFIIRIKKNPFSHVLLSNFLTELKHCYNIYLCFFSTVPAHKPHAAVNDLDPKEHDLQDTQTEYNGEENDVPKDCIFRESTEIPLRFIHQVIGFTADTEK